MKRKRLFVGIGIGILAAVLAVAIYVQSAHDDAGAYEETLIAYLDAMEEGTNKAIEYTDFPNQTIEHDYLHSPMRIVDYEVLSSTQVNENLYAFTLNVANHIQPNIYTPVYYFVGRQDGAYTVYINADYVPESLRENFNADDYSYSNPDYLGGTPAFGG